MEGVLASFAQFDNDQKAERTISGMRAALQLGRWTFQAPVGYQHSRDSSSPSLIPDERYSEMIQLGFRLVAEGSRPNDVLRRLNAAGLRSAHGTPLSVQTFRTVLRNPVYARRVVVPKWKIDCAGDFVAIVDATTFQRVQRGLERKTPDVRAYLLETGQISRCGVS